MWDVLELVLESAHEREVGDVALVDQAFQVREQGVVLHMGLQHFHELLQIREELLTQRPQTHGQRPHEHANIEPLSIVIVATYTFDHIKHILQHIHERQTIQEHDIHQLGQVNQHIDRFIELKLAQGLLQIVYTSLDDQVGEVLVLETDLSRNPCINMLLERDLADDGC